MKSHILNLLIPVSFLIIIFSTEGCNKEEVLSLNTVEITLKPNQTFNLIVSPNASGCVFKSENDNIAEVYSSGLINARLVGVTNIVVTNTDKGYLAKCKVTVTPEYEMFREPYLVFGRPKSSIKSYETRQIYQENDTSIYYSGENPSIEGLMYSFENSAYTSCICDIPRDQLSLLENYLSERYVYVGYVDNNLIARKTTDNKTYVVIQIYSSTEILVYYFPKTTAKNGISLIFSTESGKTIDGIKNKEKGTYPIN